MNRYKGKTLRIGLLGSDPCWEALLDQEGLDWELASFNSGEIDRYPVLLIPNVISKDEIIEITRYILHGGSVLTIEENREICNGKLSKCNLPYSGGDFSDIWKGPANHIYPLKNCLSRDQLYCYVDESDQVIFLPFNVRGILSNEEFGRKYFFTGDEPIGVYASKYSKGNLRKVFHRCLKYLFFKKGLPIIKKWYYPGQYNSVFSFRIDVDDYYKPHFDALWESSRKYKDMMTWFFCCVFFEDERDIVRKMSEEGYDIQSHGYFHFTFKEYN